MLNICIGPLISVGLCFLLIHLKWWGTNGLWGPFQLEYPKVPDCTVNNHAVIPAVTSLLHLRWPSAPKALWSCGCLFFPCGQLIRLRAPQWWCWRHPGLCLIALKILLIIALAGVAQWIEHGPMNQSYRFNSQSGHMPGLWARSPVGGMWEVGNNTLMFLSLSFSFPSHLSKNK